MEHLWYEIYTWQISSKCVMFMQMWSKIFEGCDLFLGFLNSEGGVMDQPGPKCAKTSDCMKLYIKHTFVFIQFKCRKCISLLLNRRSPILHFKWKPLANPGPCLSLRQSSATTECSTSSNHKNPTLSTQTHIIQSSQDLLKVDYLKLIWRCKCNQILN